MERLNLRCSEHIQPAVCVFFLYIHTTLITDDRWRDYDAEDSLRFYALRMQETGLISSTPQQIISEGTDWRFLNELKRELKA